MTLPLVLRGWLQHIIISYLKDVNTYGMLPVPFYIQLETLIGLHSKLTRRFERHFTLSVSLEGRMAYSKYLHVWGQDRIYITRRHADLLTAFNVLIYFLFHTFKH